MPARKKYKKESKAAFKKRMSKTGPARKKANRAAKRKY
tara:strand:+ start:769 stop:882 length:114 start_codon:yes stop_codon:yes gene_type:complete